MKVEVQSPYNRITISYGYVVGQASQQGFRLAAGMADKPAERPSLKEKLEAFKERAVGREGKSAPEKAKGKEEIL